MSTTRGKSLRSLIGETISKNYGGLVVAAVLVLGYSLYKERINIFALSVWHHWVLILSGSVGTVVLFNVLEKFVFREPLSKGWYAVALAAFLLFSCFQAWEEEYTSKIGREKDLHEEELKVARLNEELTSKDNMIKELRQLPSQFEEHPLVRSLFLMGKPLEGQTITASGARGLFLIPQIQAKNEGNGQSTAIQLSARLYFSEPVGSATNLWQSATSDESGFSVAFYWGTVATLNPTETWSIPEFQSNGAPLKHDIRAKIKFFYGGAPASAVFKIHANTQASR